MTQFTYLDPEGEPMMLTSGYATVKRTYDAQGRAETDMYFGLDGEHIARPDGQYGVQYIRDDSGKHIGTTYLNREGQPMTIKPGYMIVLYEHDEWNNVVQYTYFDEAGKPASMSRGRYGQRIEYERKARIRSYYIDAEGNELFLLDQFLTQNLWLNVLVALLLVVCVVFLPRKLRWGLLALYSLFILYMTLIVRESGEQRSEWTLFWSYEQFFTDDGLRVQIIQNILLFVPFGALMCSLFGGRAAILAAVVFSLLIEGTQLVFRLGLCELDDVFSNVLGSAMGWSVIKCDERARKRWSLRGERK